MVTRLKFYAGLICGGKMLLVLVGWMILTGVKQAFLDMQKMLCHNN
jgi:hypothetical protein